MITNPARFALLPVILLAGTGPVSAKEPIVPAVCEPVQAMASVTTRHPGKAVSGTLPFYVTFHSEDDNPSSAESYILLPGGDNQKSGYIRPSEFGRYTPSPGISDNRRYSVSIDREMS